MRGGRQIAERMFDPNQASFSEQMERIRQRRRDGSSGTGPPGDAGL
jgi:hypothetical protein